METETAIGAAFSRAGYNPNQMRLFKPLSEFFANGGTLGELLAVVNAVAKPLKGQVERFGNDLPDIADSRPQQPDVDGQLLGSQKVITQVPPTSAPNASGVDHSCDAPSQSRCVKAARAPSAVEIAASAQVARKIAFTAFERELTHTGRQWGNVYYRELDAMTEDGDIASGLKAHIGSLRGDDRHKTIRELMTAREFIGVLRKVRKHAA